MSKINFQFNYEAPDFKGSPTRNLGKVGSWIYDGPEKFYVAITSDGIVSRKPPVPVNGNEGYKFASNFLTVEVDAQKNPIVASVVFENLDIQTISKSNWLGPDGNEHEIDDPVLLTDAYDQDHISYDSATNTFTTSFVNFNHTWDDVRNERNGLLEYYDGKIRDDMPTDLFNAYTQLKQDLRDITTTWEGYEPVQVVFPEVDWYFTSSPSS